MSSCVCVASGVRETFGMGYIYYAREWLEYPENKG